LGNLHGLRLNFFGAHLTQVTIGGGHRHAVFANQIEAQFAKNRPQFAAANVRQNRVTAGDARAQSAIRFELIDLSVDDNFRHEFLLEKLAF
jgi:hypothetical protein